MKVRIKSGECPPYLTLGKVYEVVESDNNGFEIIADNNNISYCLVNHCEHLNGGSWEIVDE